MVDKTTLAMSYVWLSKMLAPMGTAVIATYDVVKNLERFAFLPAIAFAQIIVFLVSNRLGTKDYDGAISNVKKVLILTSIITSIALLFLCMNASFFISCFDPKNKFTDFASFVLQIISVLVVFDFIQLVLAGALRGAGDVRSVMWGRFFSCFFIFIPVSYAISKLPIQQQSVKFLLIYGTFYLTTAVMGIIFLMRIRSHKWEKTDV
jgi:Na+-driven multidrug efflux pump